MKSQKNEKSQKNTINRREFIGGMAAASAFTIVPRHVLGGPQYVPPSDKLNVAQIGCGTQALRTEMPGVITRDDVQYTCVCDPNTDSSNYVDWSRYGLRNSIRELLGDPSWGENNDGIRAGREVAREVVETYYGKANSSGNYEGCRTYVDFREMLEQETDLDAVFIVTPDHIHAAASIAAMEHNVAAITHKPVSNKLNEVRRAIQTAREAPVVSHVLAYNDSPDYYKLDAWLNGGVIGPVREVHNWTSRPFWPQGALNFPTERPDVPEGFEWDLWLGPEPHRPYHPSLTFAVYRGWYDYGAGCLGDMGNYSLWQPYRMLDLGFPISVTGRPTTVAYLNDDNTADYRASEVSFPAGSTIRFRYAATMKRPEVDVVWYSGGIKPPTPEELNGNLPREGMMFVGDDGKIICSFRGRNPRVLPESRMSAAEGLAPENVQVLEDNDEWVNAIKNNTESRGSFQSLEPVAEITALAGIAYRFPNQRLDWDAENMKFTNVPEANQYIRRNYREGWEL